MLLLLPANNVCPPVHQSFKYHSSCSKKKKVLLLILDVGLPREAQIPAYPQKGTLPKPCSPAHILLRAALCCSTVAGLANIPLAKPPSPLQQSIYSLMKSQNSEGISYELDIFSGIRWEKFSLTGIKCLLNRSTVGNLNHPVTAV